MKQRQSSITSISENSTTVNLTLLNETVTTEEGKNEETEDNMPNNSSTQKGLPGFLRRSLRNNYDEDSTTRTIPSAERPSLASTNNANSSNSINQSNSVTTTTTVGTSFSENNNDSNIKKETSKSTNNINNSDIKKDSSNSRLDSVSSQEASTAGDNNRPNLNDKSEKSYKLREFEKCINANIVDLRELRKLAWNSVPVSIHFHFMLFHSFSNHSWLLILTIISMTAYYPQMTPITARISCGILANPTRIFTCQFIS